MDASSTVNDTSVDLDSPRVSDHPDLITNQTVQRRRLNKANETKDTSQTQRYNSLPQREDDSAEQANVTSTSFPVYTEKEDRYLQDVRFGRIDLLSPWFPAVDPQHKRAKTWSVWFSRRQVLLTTALLFSIAVTLTNFIAALVLGAKFKPNNGITSIYQGSCSVTKASNTFIHVFINILSTMLLGASNLCMQLLVAPTRDETDKAHQEKRWLDIGVPSWRNLRYIRKDRLALWLTLGLSSIPIHFL